MSTAAVPINVDTSSHRVVTQVLWRSTAAVATAIAFLLADLIAWLAASATIYFVRAAIFREVPFLWITWLVGLLWFTFRVRSGFYRVPDVSPAEELRRSFLSAMMAMVVHAVLLLVAQEITPFRLFAVLIWPLLLPIDWSMRSITRSALIRAQLFGYPVIVLAEGARGREVVRHLEAHPEEGLIPVGVFQPSGARRRTGMGRVPVLGSFDDSLEWEASFPVRRAIVALDKDSDWNPASAFSHRLARRFPVLNVVTDLGGAANLWVRPRPVGVHLTLEIPHARFSNVNRAVKRAFDLLLTVPAMLVAAPIIGLAALLVKLFSPGPAFFSQDREGADGKVVRMWKVRTMVPNAEERLVEYLTENEEARREWERFLKLRNDPRVVPVIGGLLRRFSIDELPQLWHVLTGEMSLVGPRIFALWHVARYPEEFRMLRRQVPPGMTGLWQVSHRNSGDLKVQEMVDSYYIHNWSVWMDLWILFRTVRTVLTGQGAY